MIGGKQTFAAVGIKVSYAQIATFAKFGSFPDSGPSCKARRMTVESPKSPMLQNVQMTASPSIAGVHF